MATREQIESLKDNENVFEIEGNAKLQIIPFEKLMIDTKV